MQADSKNMLCELIAPFVFDVDATIFLLRQVPKSILWGSLPACLLNSGSCSTRLQSTLFKIDGFTQPPNPVQHVVKPIPIPKSMQTDSKNMHALWSR